MPGRVSGQCDWSGSLIGAYSRQYGKMPKVTASLDQLPDPADHPTFQMVPDAAG
ncbi:hypothetical protein [Rugosimonospora africana]|uniref:Uncharacterized protein n=1 Tax=Rugosimonospora africana TaxID=556532 RepID=A0A8J3QNH3_9ACTN|nr:hypothetical protein [Rugosimonospora africana]GIH14159.1 hypothetical protein Raf01_23310 [Rugosimonospora africana]